MRQALAERQASLEGAHAAVAEKERKIAGLEVGRWLAGGGWNGATAGMEGCRAAGWKF